MAEAKNNQINPLDTTLRLKSIIKLTEHKDYVCLSHAFIKQIKNIPGIEKVNIYEVYKTTNNKPTETSLLKDVLDLLTAPILYSERIRPSDSEEKSNKEALSLETQQTIFPILSTGKIYRILVIDWHGVHKDCWEHIACSLTVYNNLLSIIDEKDRDRLTGLLNRYTFDNNLENITLYSKQQFEATRGCCDKFSWIALFDIDHFKQVNDSYGHLMGDEVLILFSRLLLSTFRYSDVTFRFGGEEFIVILTGCDRQGAETVLNRFRKVIENHTFPQVGQVTVSVGYVLLDTTQLPSVLLEQADQALYHAKETGRNKVVYYETLASKKNQIDTIDSIELF